MKNLSPLLITGATGYIGGKLRERFESMNRPLRCLARRPEALYNKVAPTTQVVSGDLLDEPSLISAMDGVETAYYFVHSLSRGEDFEEAEKSSAENFARAARRSHLKKIIYLGGLGRGQGPLSAHLRSRHAVGDILRSSGVTTLEFRASIILGAGSLSFELIRALVERLPVMVTPRWVNTLAQPIAVGDVLDYLMLACDRPLSSHRVIEIGGPDRVTYGQLMKMYAKIRGLSRRMIPVPVLSPRLSGLWLGFVTPHYACIGRKLIDSIRHPSLAHCTEALEEFPVRPRGVQQSMTDALQEEEAELSNVYWSRLWDSLRPTHWGGERLRNFLVDSRALSVKASPKTVSAVFQGVGGRRGWFHAQWVWILRGWLDECLGGPGLRRGRSHPDHLRAGETLDFWRVETVEPGRRLKLKAEMKVPGRAWLQFEVEPQEGGALLRQTAVFDPRGVWGLLYWHFLYPAHVWVFQGMIERIAQEAERKSIAETVYPTHPDKG